MADPRLQMIGRTTLGPEGALRQELAELRRRLEALERGHPTVQVSAGAPSSNPRDGTLAVDTVNHRLWARDSGGWRYVGLTA